MANDSLPDEGVSRPVSEDISELRRAAERVLREYRGHKEIVASESAEGLLVEMRVELALALDALESVLDGDNPGRTQKTEDTELTVLVGDLVREIYAIKGMARALDIDGDQADLVIGLQAIAERVASGLGSVPYDIDVALSRLAKVYQ